jgi:DNA-binding CsgD family transcriptional regulator
MLEKIFVELLDYAPEIIKQKGDNSFFRQVCERLGATNLGVNLPVKNSENYFVHNTYSLEWALHYKTQNYVNIDPIVRRGLAGLMPIDWNEIGGLTKEQFIFLGEAQEFRIGMRGLTFPLHGLHGETAIFSVTADCSDREWRKLVAHHLRDFRIIGDLFHNKIIEECMGEDGLPKAPLTPREIECLKWCGEGKSQPEIGEILTLSERTVRFFLESARHKLNCLNTTHAVATAVLRGII